MKLIPFQLIRTISCLLLLLIVTGCPSDEDEDDNPTPSGANVNITSADLSADLTMALSATAQFNAVIAGIDQSQNIAYVWYLETSRGTFLEDNLPSTSPLQTTQNVVSVRGDESGSETIKVEVINVDSGEILAEKSLTFEIIPASDVAGCFDSPLLFLRDGDFTRVTVLDLESGNTGQLQAPVISSFSDLDPTGTFYLRQDLTDNQNIDIYVESCDPAFPSWKIVEGGQTELPKFGPNGDYVYYSTIVDNPSQVEDPRAREIIRYDLETGQEMFITNSGLFSSNISVSPDGQWIAFEQSEPQFNSSGTFTGSIVHLAIIPSEGGTVQELVQIGWEDARLGGLDWSPDSQDIIFYIDAYANNTGPLDEGIHRVQRTGGSSFLVYSVGGNSSSARNVAYYDNGNRIAFEDGGDIYSIDANGGDLQVLFDEGSVFLNFSWEP